MLKVVNVSKSFGSINALSDVTFEVDSGEFVFLTGPSGAGKTTLLRLLLREMKPDSGEIILGNQDITKLKTHDVPYLRQHIGVVFQDFKILPERTVKENVEVALAVIGLKRSEWDARVKRVLELVGLLERLNVFPSQLSGGELQRVSLARALVVNPKIILADEPTGNLDWDTADKIMQLFEKINEEGKTIVMATHHKIIIDKFKKRTIELKDGKVTKGGGLKENTHHEDKEKHDKEANLETVTE
jgi:cell division transport system ATP-binding protein